MDYLTTLLENSSFPLLSALLLGIMTAISPCPMATNITAIGFISKDIKDKRRVFINGLVYTLGRTITYVLIAAVLLLGADQIELSGFFQKYGEKFLGPLLLIIGLVMLNVIRIRIPGLSITEKATKKGVRSYWDVLLIGILFALAFCPYSGVLYFMMLIPMTISSTEGLLLPLVFAIATGVPVIIFAWLLAYTVSGVGKLYNNLLLFEKWFRKIIALIFVGVGLYYIYIIYIQALI